MYVSAAWSGSNLLRGARLAVASGYVVAVSAPYLMDLTFVTDLAERSDPAAARWYAVAAIAWTALLVTWLVRLIRARHRLRFVAESSATILILLTPVPVLAHLSPVVFVLMVLVAFVIEVRHLARGNALAFALVTVVGVALICATAMADVENEETTGNIDNFFDSLLWAAGTVLRFDRFLDMDPTTVTGRILGVVIVIMGVLFAAILFTALTSWVIGGRRDDDESALRDTVAQAVDSAVSRVLGRAVAQQLLAAEHDPAHQPPPTLWLDVDRIVGTTPRVRWRMRSREIRRVVEFLDAGGPWGPLLGLPVGARTVCLVGEVLRDDTPGTGIDIVRSPTAAYLVAEARPGDVAVTSRRRVRDDLEANGVRCVPESTFRDVVPTAG